MLCPTVRMGETRECVCLPANCNLDQPVSKGAAGWGILLAGSQCFHAWGPCEQGASVEWLWVHGCLQRASIWTNLQLRDLWGRQGRVGLRQVTIRGVLLVLRSSMNACMLMHTESMMCMPAPVTFCLCQSKQREFKCLYFIWAVEGSALPGGAGHSTSTPCFPSRQQKEWAICAPALQFFHAHLPFLFSRWL